MFYEKRRLGRKTLPRGDPRAGDTRQAVGHLGPCCNGVVTTGTWRVVALVGKSRAALGSGGQGDMGTWVSSRDS